MSPMNVDLIASIPVAAEAGQDELLTPNVVAAILGVSPNTLPMWRWQQKGPPFVRLGDGPSAAVRYRRSELMKWLAERSIIPQREADHA